jgi:hypothetical protein
VTADILAIAGAGTTLISIVAIVILVYKLVDSVASERASMAAETLAERSRDAMGFARDAALAAQKKAEAERDSALTRLATVEKQRNEAQGAPHVESKDGAGALAGVNAELSALMPLDDSGGAGAAAGANHGHAGQDAVPPASAGAPAGPGRSA